LERRLDNVVYRLGYAASRVEARQIVNHGHFTVNSKKVDIPSYLLRVGDVVEVREKSRENVRIKELAEQAARKTSPAWLEVSADQFTGTVIAIPSREEIDVPIEEHLIVELYSR
jgi:small subunit ribosomal protein S4